MSWFVGFYPALPPETRTDRALEREYFLAVAGLPGVRGFEVPYNDTLPGLPDEALAPELELLVTALPRTLGRSAADPSYGLASPDPAGRAAAVEETHRLHEAVHLLGTRAGRNVVHAVELHSAPSRTCVADAFAESLAEICRWDWGGTRIVVEHCDAVRPDHPHEKGYLPIDAEIAVVADLAPRARAPVGLSVNWGRSVIEGRDVATAIAHLERARAGGVLAGLMFSGCSPLPSAFGEPWADQHLPPATGPDTDSDSDPDSGHSLMTAQEITASLVASGTPDFAGLKMGLRPTSLPLPLWRDRFEAALRTVDDAQREAARRPARSR